MSSERVWFRFFILLALTLNVGFVYGDIDNPIHHDKIELFLAFVVSLICTILKSARDYVPVGGASSSTSDPPDPRTRVRQGSVLWYPNRWATRSPVTASSADSGT